MQYILYLLCGLFAGTVSGLLGIGGAVLIIPILIYGFHYSQHDAQGTSLAVLLPPIGILAAYRYWQCGHVKILPALIIAAAFIIGGYLGASCAVDIPSTLMKRIFGGALTAIGIFMMLTGK
jgi:uncharacterized membrane protein YfcA